ncbi:outer membrane beta-barrel protein [uncultured Muriicola sp.]|uniref:outer membrane beta-barrel protein n=1 Tax=uncultured Muriicola sp. TaxID=1583102 RepID=UPI002636C034|nr:outer membrane beta-barrel protein [uncultured Muriicola sp.]
MKKKNIEKIFQEKLGDYSQLPEEHVWDNIAASLDKKHKKRRILPIWWQLGGVAAVLIIGIFLFLPKEELPSSNEIITNTQAPANVDESTDIKIGRENPGETKALESTEAENTIIIASEKDVNESYPKNERSTDGNIMAKKSERETPKENGVVLANVTPLDNKKVNTIETGENGNNNIPQLTDDLAQNEVSSVVKQAENTEKTPEDISSYGNAESFAKTSVSEQKKQDPTIEKEVKNDNKTSIFDAIAAQEEKTEQDITGNKWSVGPRVAPVFFSSLSQGSPIHSSFQNNAKSGNVNLSYGLAVTYDISKKVRLRSGVHKVDFGYDTRDVSFSSSINGATNGIINNIDYSLSSKNLVVRSNTRSGKIASENAQDVSGPDPSLNGKMIQEFGYFEVPLELTYQILDKKLGVNVIGGVSSLFLVNNSVILESDGIATEMGEANNLNDLNVSTNFGIGISYQLNNTLQLSLEPMFKYQLNTFSEAAGNFQPFSMGVYSGLNFKF